MARKRYYPEQFIINLREAEVLFNQKITELEVVQFIEDGKHEDTPEPTNHKNG